MKVIDLIKEFDLKLFSGESGVEKTITGGYVSDLLSDVMGFAQEGQVWVTLQTHQNVVAVASLKDLAAIVLVKGYEPEPDTITHSNEEGIPILGTHLTTYEFTGKLFRLLENS
ncbi:MAG TPA: DRTGG domain-containing protein [Prolixibacteraceae bacterium]|nr:DRTGG domain-containing protein [Prolixibacteraceae bacterium]